MTTEREELWDLSLIWSENRGYSWKIIQKGKISLNVFDISVLIGFFIGISDRDHKEHYFNLGLIPTWLLLFQNNNNLAMTADDCLISYLPLAHSYERLCEVRVIYNGIWGLFSFKVEKKMEIEILYCLILWVFNQLTWLLFFWYCSVVVVFLTNVSPTCGFQYRRVIKWRFHKSYSPVMQIISVVI